MSINNNFHTNYFFPLFCILIIIEKDNTKLHTAYKKLTKLNITLALHLYYFLIEPQSLLGAFCFIQILFLKNKNSYITNKQKTNTNQKQITVPSSNSLNTVNVSTSKFSQAIHKYLKIFINIPKNSEIFINI